MSGLGVLQQIMWQITDTVRKIENLSLSKNKKLIHIIQKTALEDKLPTDTHTGNVSEPKNSPLYATVC